MSGTPVISAVKDLLSACHTQDEQGSCNNAPDVKVCVLQLANTFVAIAGRNGDDRRVSAHRRHQLHPQH